MRMLICYIYLELFPGVIRGQEVDTEDWLVQVGCLCWGLKRPGHLLEPSKMRDMERGKCQTASLMILPQANYSLLFIILYISYRVGPLVYVTQRGTELFQHHFLKGSYTLQTNV